MAQASAYGISRGASKYIAEIETFLSQSVSLTQSIANDYELFHQWVPGKVELTARAAV